MTALLPNRTGRALSKARAEVDRLEQAVTRWQSDAAVKRAALDDLEAGAGDAVLADETGTVARQLAVDAQELRFGIDGANRAAEAAQRQLRAARWTVADAQAEQLREKAATVRAEAVKRQARVDELRQALNDYEGGDWRPWEPERGSFGMVVAAPPRTPLMFAEADELDRRAAALEAQVAGERQRASVRTPSAHIHGDPSHSSDHFAASVDCGVSDGQGAVVFEIVQDGLPVQTVTLPDDRGRWGTRTIVDLAGYGQLLEVRCAGEVLASRRFEKPTIGPIKGTPPISTVLGSA